MPLNPFNKLRAAASVRLGRSRPCANNSSPIFGELLRFGALSILLSLCSVARVQADILDPLSGSGQLKPGGEGSTAKKINRQVFSHPAANMPGSDQLSFTLGRSFFKRLWVSSPASTKAADGLGPLYNARSCLQCHTNNGRGHTPNGEGDNAISLFLRLSVPPLTEAQRSALRERRLKFIPEPTYGEQLQDFAVPGLRAEGQLNIEYTERAVSLEGDSVTLRHPHYQIVDLGYGKMDPSVMISPRVAPPMIGLGLLAAIDEADLLAQEDPDDKNGDGISGRANRVRTPESGEIQLGRFGWKAGNASIAAQNAQAFAGDIGISTPLDPRASGDCTAKQAECLAAPNGNTEQYDNSEVGAEMAALVAFYTENLAVPVRRNAQAPEVLRGQKIFNRVGCASCHTPGYRLPSDAGALYANQTIWPYTDLLLHDMGEGLADQRPEGDANGREWKTPPLWGIGLTQVVSGHTQFLHDGRARSLLEAILWHGGEATTAREAVRQLTPEARQDLIKFLESL